MICFLHMIVYRFLSLASDQHREQLDRAVRASELLFSCPLGFNDPLEGRFTVIVDGDLGIWRRTFDLPHIRRAAGLPVAGSLTDQTVNNLAQFIRTREGPITDELRRSMLCEVFVCCLSERNDHPLMWSHYADSHRGVCLEFDLTRDKWYLQETHRVLYKGTSPAVSYFTEDHVGAASAVLLTKAAFWDYEAEWRTLSIPGEAGFRKFTPGMLTGVVLGVATSTENRKMVADLCAKSATELRLLEAKIRPGAYAIDVK
jgi:hypothetical protein